mgnify:CR=1 FL=1
MMMIKTVSEIIEGIIEREASGSKTAVTESFQRVRNSLGFFLTNDNEKGVIRLRN